MRAEIMIDGKWQPFAGGGIYTGGDIPVLRDRDAVYIPKKCVSFDFSTRLAAKDAGTKDRLERLVENMRRYERLREIISLEIAGLIHEHGTYGMGHA